MQRPHGNGVGLQGFDAGLAGQRGIQLTVMAQVPHMPTRQEQRKDRLDPARAGYAKRASNTVVRLSAATL